MGLSHQLVLCVPAFNQLLTLRRFHILHDLFPSFAIASKATSAADIDATDCSITKVCHLKQVKDLPMVVTTYEGTVVVYYELS